LNNKTRKITEGATLVAIVGVFLLINRQTIGLLEGYLFWLMPLPILIYAAKYGWKDAIAPFISIMILSFIVALPTTTIIVFITGFTGLVYGSGVKKGKSNFWLLGSTLIFTTINDLVTTVLFASFFGYDLAGEVKTISESIESYGYQITNLDQIIATIIPISLFLSACLEALLVHILANFILKRLKIKVNPMRSINDIVAPKWLGWVLLGFMVLNAASGYLNYSTLIQETIFTINVIAEIIFSIFGLIDIMIYSKATKRNYIMLFGVILVIVLPSSLMIIGIMDIVTDFRKSMIERNKNVPK